MSYAGALLGGEEPVKRGAYGLALTGLIGAEELLVRAGETWPATEILLEHGPPGDATEYADESRGTVRFVDAVVHVEREPARAVFRFAGEPRVDAVVHPYLPPVAALLAHWHKREALHAGGFIHGGGVWGVVADRGGGKSSTLAQLALHGEQIVADDLLVVDADAALAGPRVIDLREDVSAELGVGEPLGIVGTRSRWRFRLDPVKSAYPLCGWVFLEWADEFSVDKVSASERLERLGAQRMIRRRPTDPATLLRLASFPGFVIRRPSVLGSLAETARFLRDALPPGRAHG
jgi:hypothetical protein